MSQDAAVRNAAELDAIRAVAQSGQDHPVVMVNLNRYTDEAGFPDGAPYLEYMRVLEALLPEVGGAVLWRSPVAGQPVGAQDIDEILVAWYPSHRAFLELPEAPGGRENFRLRRECVAEAVIHRCRGDAAPLELPGDAAELR